jgi:hypothetical protein
LTTIRKPENEREGEENDAIVAGYAFLMLLVAVADDNHLNREARQPEEVA